MNYELTVTISKFEFHIIQEMRKIQQSGYGDLLLTFAEGQCVNLRPTISTNPKYLKELQSTIK